MRENISTFEVVNGLVWMGGNDIVTVWINDELHDRSIATVDQLNFNTDTVNCDVWTLRRTAH